MIRIKRLQSLVLVMFIFMLSHLSSVWAAEFSEDRQTEIRFNRMVVAPILVGHRQPNMNAALDDTLSCPIDQICANDPTIEPDAGALMMRMIHTELQRRFGGHVVDLSLVRSAYTDIRLDGAQDTPRVMVERLGRMLSADLVMVGTLWRYRERETIDGFPDRPASVAFGLYLVDPGTGRRLWRRIYDASQDFATSSAAKFAQRIKMGLTWLSADELARHGIKEALRDFPQKVKPMQKP